MTNPEHHTEQARSVAMTISQWEAWRLSPGQKGTGPRAGPKEGRPCCPHCGHSRVQRWGAFSGRQRHRCTSCRRTFSTFTATPLAGSASIHTWIPFFNALAGRLSVRAAARAAGISVATAFRRRHRVLHWVLQSNTRHPLLRGEVVLREVRFPESFKGSRTLNRPGRRWSLPIEKRYRAERQAIVVLFCEVRPPAGVRRVTRTALAGVFAPSPRYHPVAELLDREVAPAVLRRYFPGRKPQRQGAPESRHPLLGRRDGKRDASLSAAGRDLAGARMRFRGWMAGFRGVATRYLANYTAWFERVDRHFLVDERGDPIRLGPALSGSAFSPFIGPRPQP